LKIVTATGGSIASGRDVNITIVNGEPLDAQAVLALIAGKLNRDPHELARALAPGASLSADESLSQIMMFAQSSASGSEDPYVSYFSDRDHLKRLLGEARVAFERRSYLQAHHNYREALTKDDIAPLRTRLVSDYLVSGYIGFALASDLAGLDALIEDVHTRFDDALERNTEITLTEAHQEIATRQTGAAMLEDNRRLIDRLLVRHGEEPALLNLKGLLFRRMGERRDSPDRAGHLRKACEVFEALQEAQGDDRALPAEYQNNWAISLIRMYELNGDAAALDQAERLLAAIDFNPLHLPVSDYLALPKARNNTGNVFKQKLALSGSYDDLDRALTEYTAAEFYWDEAHSPYEWAMLQKNKADARTTYLVRSGFERSQARAAMAELDKALRYRTRERAPYQYQRTVDVRDRLAALMAEND